MAKPTVNTNPVANRYAGRDELIVEYSSNAGGGVINMRVIDGRLSVDLYGHDSTVDIRVGKGSE